MWCYDHDVLHQIFVEKGREKLNKKIDRITTLAGLGALIIFMPMTGYMFGWLITVESQNQILLDSQPKLMQLPLADSWIEDVFAEEQSVEGFKYKVTISDGIGTSNDLK